MFMYCASYSRKTERLCPPFADMHACPKLYVTISELSFSCLFLLLMKQGSHQYIFFCPLRTHKCLNQQSTNKNIMVEINRRSRSISKTNKCKWVTRGMAVPGKIQVTWGHTHFVLTKSPSLLQKTGFTVLLCLLSTSSVEVFMASWPLSLHFWCLFNRPQLMLPFLPAF